MKLEETQPQQSNSVEFALKLVLGATAVPALLAGAGMTLIWIISNGFASRTQGEKVHIFLLPLAYGIAAIAAAKNTNLPLAILCSLGCFGFAYAVEWWPIAIPGAIILLLAGILVKQQNTIQ